MKYKPPLVSVAMTTYNHELFISNALESVLAQDYSNFEIMISDDASTDNTIDIINDYLERYTNKIKLLTTEKNMGVTANWFKCVSTCSGKYIIGLAGDDEFLPGILSKQVKILEDDKKIAICYTNASVFHVPSQKELYLIADKTPTKSGGLEVALSHSIYYSITSMFRQKLVPKHNIFSDIRHGSDLAFYKEIMIISGKDANIYYLPEVLYKYQKHSMNITVTQSEYRKDHIECIKILQKKYPHYKNFLDPAIYDFCCVALFKSLSRLHFKDAIYFLFAGLTASRGSLVFFRAILWGMKFHINRFLRGH
jgi:glycosyltransferase involved in cell wall biosynthesis